METFGKETGRFHDKIYLRNLVFTSGDFHLSVFAFMRFLVNSCGDILSKKKKFKVTPSTDKTLDM